MTTIEAFNKAEKSTGVSLKKGGFGQQKRKLKEK